MVLDMGSSSTKLDILEVDQGVIEVWTHSQLKNIGGDTFTNRLVDFFNLGDVKGIDSNELFNMMEKVKRELSVKNEAEWMLDDDKHGIFSRALFEGLCDDLVKTVKEGIEETLREIEGEDFTRSEIKEVILVGGSSRLPMIQNLVRE